MPNTFFGLTIGKSGLYTYQAALNTMSHNASNVDTRGYTRQKVYQAATRAISVNNQYGMQGTGVDVTGVYQIRDKYYDNKFRENNTMFGLYNNKAYYMDSLQSYFSEVTANGQTKSLSNFFNAINGLTNDPSNTTKRTEVTEFGKSLAETVNGMSEKLSMLQKENNDEIKGCANKINSIAERIASLNLQINTIEVKGGMANDLRDARNLLIDELSEYVNITVEETPMVKTGTINDYMVKVDGKILVNTYEYNTLVAEPLPTSINQNDVEGLYNLKWSDGQSFASGSKSLGGKLQALFEMRDGNNKHSFDGNITAGVGDTTVLVTGTNMNDLLKLNIPDSNGTITINHKEYTYSSFDMRQRADGTYEYQFHLKEPITEAVNNKKATIGKPVDFKGIPYYQAQLNEFVRTMSKEFNDIHVQGKDLYNKINGLDFFNSTVKGTGEEIYFEGLSQTNWLSSMPDAGTVKINEGYHYVKASYYNMTAKDFKVSEALAKDPKKLACADGSVEEAEASNAVNLHKILELRNDMDMFKQGTPDMFLQTIVAELGIDAKCVESFVSTQDFILKTIENQRTSISGVDSDEEAMDMIKFKNAYNLNSKIISVMNEVYDQLINRTGL